MYRASSSFATIFQKVVCCRDLTKGLYVGKDWHLGFIFFQIFQNKIENIAAKGDTALYEQCLLLSQFFQKMSASNASASGKNAIKISQTNLLWQRRNRWISLTRGVNIFQMHPVLPNLHSPLNSTVYDWFPFIYKAFFFCLPFSRFSTSPPLILYCRKSNLCLLV